MQRGENRRRPVVIAVLGDQNLGRPSVKKTVSRRGTLVMVVTEDTTVLGSVVEVGDVVLVRWKGKYLLHLVKEADAGRLLIGNNLGKTNGWVDREDVRGIVIGVED